MKQKILRGAVFALCALVPAAYVVASEGLEPRYEVRYVKEVPRAGGAGADYFPNVPMTTHEGKEVRFYDDLIAGKTVVINFMYAQCEGICPGATNNLRKVQKMLEDMMGRDLFFYSITLKPEQDTPEALATYAATNRVGPGWTFLTSTPENVELLRQKLGFTDPDPALDADTSSHIGMILYGNESRQQWAACPSGSDPELMAEQILWVVPEDRIPPHLKQHTTQAKALRLLSAADGAAPGAAAAAAADPAGPAGARTQVAGAPGAGPGE